ncbi:MAG: pyridoxamine 5'-phosphate oxidase family protein [Christensenella sp.]|uniref:pyridoxamine 5'-phosphate oxidase family protein n=1 Tax=Christensenella sp. TaxID=1935934 RepID=UPI002B1F698F|nr:pyridoxamine 5'-phosphate oxidase family protein [Christensenella sp.]MEA5002223.1 pyridoxamine 5'-phosphate oxidase family protein [Christensenella sp.]
MFNDVFKEVLTHNGVVSITTYAGGSAHVSNTWNSYLQIYENDKILIPAAWMHQTEKNINENDKIILSLGSPEVQGKMGMGTGFVIDGTAKFISSGEAYDMMKEKYSFLTRVLEVTAKTVKQTI